MARSKDDSQTSPRHRDRPKTPEDCCSDNGAARGAKAGEQAGRGCPVGDIAMLWGLVACLAIGVPFLATRIPTAARTDLIWWMAGVVYQIPPPAALPESDGAMDHGSYFKVLTHVLPDLKELGISAVRLQQFFPSGEDEGPVDFYQISDSYGSLEDFELFVNKLDTLGLHLVLDLPLAYTSVAHTWFWEDRHKKAMDTSYLWSKKPIADQDHDAYFTHVLETWIRRGVDGFIFLEYDTLQLRNRSNVNDLNHIQTVDDATKKIQNLVNITTSFRQLFDFYQEEYEGTVFFAVDVVSSEEHVWQSLYNSGVDAVISHDMVHTLTDVSQGDLNSYHLRTGVQRVLARVPRDNWKAWEMFSSVDLEVKISEDHQSLLNLIHLLLPGSAYLSAPQIPMITDYEPRQAPMKHFKELISWRLTPAATWGDTQVTLTDEEIFSFARFAYGKSFARYLIITNFGTTAQHRNFTLHNDKLKVPDLGTIKHLTCGTATGLQSDPPHQLESVISLNSTVINPMCGLIVELTLPGFL